jgi:hypothetical protein
VGPQSGNCLMSPFNTYCIEVAHGFWIIFAHLL